MLARITWATCAALLILAADARAQPYPARPITMVVPFPAGGPTDTIARVVAERMRVSLGQPLIIENVTGADGSIAVGRVARATPDGYTLSFGTWSTHVVNGAALALSYDVVNDFTPVGLVSDSPMVLIVNTAPANNLQEFVAWLKANPGKASQGTPGVSGAAHLAGVFFQDRTGARFQFVPYRGVGPAMQDLLGGRIDFMFDFVANSLAQVRAGKLKALAVLSQSRLGLLPNVPTVDEAGLPGLHVSSWQAIWAPRATPTLAVAKLNRALMDALGEPSVRQRLVDLAQKIPPGTARHPRRLRHFRRPKSRNGGPSSRPPGSGQTKKARTSGSGTKPKCRPCRSMSAVQARAGSSRTSPLGRS